MSKRLNGTLALLFDFANSTLMQEGHDVKHQKVSSSRSKCEFRPTIALQSNLPMM